MTVEEIDAHARRYSQSYKNPKSLWNDPDNRAKMERKVVLANGLRRWGRFNASDADIVDDIEEGKEFIEPGELPAETAVTAPAIVEKKTESEIMTDLGFGADF